MAMAFAIKKSLRFNKSLRVFCIKIQAKPSKRLVKAIVRLLYTP